MEPTYHIVDVIKFVVVDIKILTIHVIHGTVVMSIGKRRGITTFVMIRSKLSTSMRSKWPDSAGSETPLEQPQ